MGLQKQKCASLLEKFQVELGTFDSESQDRLQVIFNQQLAFRKKIDGPSLNTPTPAQVGRAICAQMEALTHECAELRELLPWKEWKKYPENFKIDYEEAKFEVADMMCFLMNIACNLGMDYVTFFNYVHAKQLHNVERQEDPKYGYIKKDSVPAKKGKETKTTETKKK